jgi:hypothetical protein
MSFACLDDPVVGILARASLLSASDLSLLCLWIFETDRTVALSTSVRMINGIHRFTENGRTDTHIA